MQMKIERNADCPCGSGMRYKKCCLLKEQIREQFSAPALYEIEAFRSIVARSGEVIPLNVPYVFLGFYTTTENNESLMIQTEFLSQRHYPRFMNYFEDQLLLKYEKEKACEGSFTKIITMSGNEISLENPYIFGMLMEGKNISLDVLCISAKYRNFYDLARLMYYKDNCLKLSYKAFE